MKSLAYKITSYIALFTLIGFGSISVIYYFNNKKQLHAEHVDKVALINKVKKSEVESYITNIKTRLSYFDQKTSSLTAQILNDSCNYAIGKKFRNEIASLTQNSAIERIYITSSDGEVYFPLNQHHSDSNRINLFEDKLNEGDLKTLIKPVPYFTISGIYENVINKNSYYCYVFFPIHRQTAEKHGVLVAKLNMKELHTLIQREENKAIESILIKRNVQKYIQISPDRVNGTSKIQHAHYTPLYNHTTLIGVKELDQNKSKLSLIEHGEWCVLTVMDETILFKNSKNLLQNTLILSIAFIFLIIAFFIFYIKSLIINPILKINSTLFEISNGKFSTPIHYGNNDEFSTTFSGINLINSRLLKAEKIINDLNNNKEQYIPISKDDKFNIKLQTLQAFVRKLRLNQSQQNWLMTGLTKHSEMLHQNHVVMTLEELTGNVIKSISKYTNMQIGNFYVRSEDTLTLIASYGSEIEGSKTFEIGEGLIGECAESQTTICSLFQHNNLTINSGLGGTKKIHVLLVPLIVNNFVVGVIELCSITPISPIKTQLLETLSENIAHTIDTLQA